MVLILLRMPPLNHTRTLSFLCLVAAAPPADNSKSTPSWYRYRYRRGEEKATNHQHQGCISIYSRGIASPPVGSVATPWVMMKSVSNVQRMLMWPTHPTQMIIYFMMAGDLGWWMRRDTSVCLTYLSTSESVTPLTTVYLLRKKATIRYRSVMLMPIWRTPSSRCYPHVVRGRHHHRSGGSSSSSR